ncbi:unnamed protein product [Durusdinium trenchii]|uniref:Dihydroorotate dehydrogenase catalytic domain-containing protein n=2 Tax=Durusdinium trenchii TaxID=1381693 RepID=A0ABP0PHD7_9DINO
MAALRVAGVAFRNSRQLQRWSCCRPVIRWPSHIRCFAQTPGPMAPPRNAEEMQKFINEYDQKVAAEEAAESSFWRRFNSNVGAWLGAVVAGGILYVLHCVDDVSSTLSDVWGSFLRQLSEESQRKILLQAARWRVLPKDMDKDDPYLVTEPLEGLRFFAPVGLAPGLDPLGEGITAFFDLGFAFVEVGPVAPGSSESAALAHTLSTRDSSQQIARFGLLGASIGGSKEELLEQISSLGSYVRYFAVDAEHVRDVDALPKLMRELTLAALKLPGGPRIFLRLPACWPDASVDHEARCSAVGALAEALRSSESAGLILCHDDAAADCRGTEETRRKHRDLISAAFQRTKGDIVIIASGGMRHGRDALDAVEAGATAVQISSILLTEGPRACRRIKDEVAQLLMQEGHENLQSLVGVAVLRQTGRMKPKKKRNPWKQKA